MLPKQPGNAEDTWVDVDDLTRDVGFKPRTPTEDSVARIVAWYRKYVD